MDNVSVSDSHVKQLHMGDLASTCYQILLHQSYTCLPQYQHMISSNLLASVCNADLQVNYDISIDGFITTHGSWCVVPASSCCRHLWLWWKDPSARSCWTAPCRRGCVSLQLPLGTFAGSMDTGHSLGWGPRVGEEEEEHLYGFGMDTKSYSESIYYITYVGVLGCNILPKTQEQC